MRTLELYPRILYLNTGECADALEFLLVKDVFGGLLGCDTAFDPEMGKLDDK